MENQRLAQGMRFLLFLSAGAWLVVAGAFWWRSSLPGWMTILMVAALAANGLLMAWFAWQVGQDPPNHVGLCLIYLTLNLLALFLDDFGLADFFYALYGLALFVLCARLYWIAKRSSS